MQWWKHFEKVTTKKFVSIQHFLITTKYYLTKKIKPLLCLETTLFDTISIKTCTVSFTLSWKRISVD